MGSTIETQKQVQYLDPSYEIVKINDTDLAVYKKLEHTTRVCYQSFGKITDDSYKKLLTHIMTVHHEAMIEHDRFRLNLARLFFGYRVIVNNDYSDNVWDTSFKDLMIEHSIKEMKYLSFTYSDKNRVCYRIISGNPRIFRELYNKYKTKNHIALACIVYLKNKYPLLFQDFDLRTYIEDNFIFSDCDTNASTIKEGMISQIENTSKYIDLMNNEEVNQLPVEELIKHQIVSVIFNNVPRGFTHEEVRMRSAVQSWSEDFATMIMTYPYDLFGEIDEDIDNSFLVDSTDDLIDKLKESIKKLKDFIMRIVEEITIIESNCDGSSRAQESSRYVDYSSTMGDGLKVINPPVHVTDEQWEIMCEAYEFIGVSYQKLRDLGLPKQIARDILCIGLKSQLINTAQLKDWIHILKLRTAKTAHPIMHVVMRPFCRELQSMYPQIKELQEITWKE
jgi:thymidylate synthase ThyX